MISQKKEPAVRYEALCFSDGKRPDHRMPGHEPGKTGGRRIRLIVCFLMLMGTAQQSRGQQVCDFYLTSCPKAFDGDTIHVPMSVIAMGPRVHGCEGDTTGTGDSTMPSLVFLIDNSGSMTQGSGATPGNDRMGSRYTVTKALLDTIYKTQPSAEVGIVVFCEHLFFDTRTSQYFSKYFVKLSPTVNNDGEPNQAYLPPMRLDSAYDGKLGIDIIKDLLATDTINPGTDSSYVKLAYKPQFAVQGNTNINVGFEAAREALATTRNPRSRQFIIFYSDGMPAGNFQMHQPANAFVEGANTPTTFTVFFSPDSTAPATLDSMTRHIRSNGYSATNPTSALWAIQTSYSTLLTLITNRVIGTILSGSPKTMIVSAVTLQDTSTIYANGYFVFPERFPLQKDLTKFIIPLLYQYTDRVSGTIRDTVINITFWVKRDAGPVNLRNDITISCWTRSLQFTYGPNPVSLISDEMQPVGIRFTSTDPMASATTPATLMSSIDTESVIMTKSGQTWTASFMRYNTASAAANNSRLEHRNADSIIIVYRNPKLPLDTLRVAVPFVNLNGPTVQSATILRASNRSGSDTLRVVFNGPVNCQTLMSAPPQTVFAYYDSSVKTNLALQGATFIGPCTGTRVTEVRILLINKQFTVMPWEDSLSFTPSSPYVVDTSGAHPPSVPRKKPVDAGNQHIIELAAWPNPVTPGTPINADIIKAYSNVIGGETYGTIISVYSNVPLRQITVNGVAAYGTADLYDAVGNLVQTKLPLVANDRPAGVYGVFWNLRNRNTRLVGSGTYLAMVFTTDITGQKATRRIKVGVKK